MTDLTFDVPETFWTDEEPEVVHIRRVAPGRLEVVDPETAARFVPGREPPDAPPGPVELIEFHLCFSIDDDGDRVLRPWGRYYRVFIGANGVVASKEADRQQLAPAELCAKYGWFPTGAEEQLLVQAVSRLVWDYEYFNCAMDPLAFFPPTRPLD